MLPSRQKGRFAHRRPEEVVIVTWGTRQGLVGRELRQRVQPNMLRRAMGDVRSRAEYPLTGLIVCR